MIDHDPRQVDLLDAIEDSKAREPLRFNGPDQTPETTARLAGQLRRIVALMADGVWRSLPEISASTGDPEASISAQLRHTRKARFGASTVDRRHRTEGLYEYRLDLSPATRELLATHEEPTPGAP